MTSASSDSPAAQVASCSKDAPSLTGGGQTGPNASKAPRSRARREDSPDVRHSKTLSYILRHGAQKEGLKMRSDGFVRVDELLKRPKLKQVDLPTLKRLVAENEKRRYALAEEPDPIDPSAPPMLWIRANQGHSVQVEDLKLERIERLEDCPVMVHGTFRRHWEAIQKEGLKVMNRHHIHCASGLFGEEGVTSGMRSSCDMFIYIDVEKALNDGILLEKSANGVILTKGLDGVLPPKYFSRVQTKKGDILYSLEPASQ